MKTAYQTLLNESGETYHSIREFTNQAIKNGEGYPYVAGVLAVMLEDAIFLLPKAKRAEFRERMYRMALEQTKKVA